LLVLRWRGGGARQRKWSEVNTAVRKLSLKYVDLLAEAGDDVAARVAEPAVQTETSMALPSSAGR
jgi:hypothetical protein